MNYLVYLYLIVICYTLNPFFKKQICKDITNYSYLLMNHITVSLILLLYTSYLLINNSFDINNIEKLNTRQYMYFIGGALTSIFGTLMLINLVRMKDVSYVIPHIQSFVTLSVLLFGFLFFKEKLTINKMIGVLMITLGLYFINKKN